MKSLLKIAIVIPVILFGSSLKTWAQLTIGYGVNWNFSKAAIVEENHNTSLFLNERRMNEGVNYSVAYLFKSGLKLNYQLQSLSFNSHVRYLHNQTNSQHSSRFDYRTGLYYVNSLNAQYLFRLPAVPALSFNAGLGVGAFCSECPKGGPYYLPTSYSSKSKPDGFKSGIYSNGWESEYNPGLKWMGNIYLGVSYQLARYHLFTAEFQAGQAHTWSDRHVIRFENNGLVPDYDQYEDSYIVIENRSRYYAFSVKYELMLSIIPDGIKLLRNKRIKTNPD